jgi:hypothetical protein
VRSIVLVRNAYLPVNPSIAARWGAFCALLGGTLGVAYSVAYTLLTNGSTPDGAAAWWDHAPTGQLLFVATFLSVLGIFGLYATLVVSSGHPGRLALAGAAFGVLSATAILALHALRMAMMVGWWSPGQEGFPWWVTIMQILDYCGIGGCVVSLSLLGVSAFRMRLWGTLSALPFVVAALWPVSIALLILLNMSGMEWATHVSWLSGTLPFGGAAFSGWVLLKSLPAEHR